MGSFTEGKPMFVEVEDSTNMGFPLEDTVGCVGGVDGLFY